MDKQKIDRINELGRLMKQRALTPQETAQQARLRREYLEEFRAALRGTCAQDTKEKTDAEANSSENEKG